MKANVLGTEYKIEIRKISEDDFMKNNKFTGYCCEDEKLIVLADLSEEEYFSNMTDVEKEVYRKRTLRHELIHAFLNESGLSDSASIPNCGWAKHEEMVDWIAIQFPKILKAFIEADCVGLPGIRLDEEIEMHIDLPKLSKKDLDDMKKCMKGGAKCLQ